MTSPGRRLLLGYLGDDFSGSTDVLDVLARFGLRTVLFTRVPSREDLAALDGVDAIGIAGNTRSLATERMSEVLLPAFELLRDLGPSIVHYKVCSTFDSSPRVGSIGRAMDAGAEVFGAATVPVLVAAPELGRYCVFGNLFARSGLDSEPFRLDRHPTMRRHPVTPMDESDLRVHLSRQTHREVAILDVLEVAAGAARALEAYRKLLDEHPGAILIDALTEEHLAAAGEVLYREAESGRARPLFVVGSSGVEMALGDAWTRAGLSPGRLALPAPGPAEPILVLSGSCSPVTRRQVERAVASGFAAIAVDTAEMVSGEAGPALLDIAGEAARKLRRGESVIVHTALGPEDPRIDTTRARLREAVGDPSQLGGLAAEKIGGALAMIGRRVLGEVALQRIAVTGGDTGGVVARELGIERLEIVSPMAPGSPLCRALGADSPAAGLEIVFKGGQVGTPDIFVEIARGTCQ